MSSNTGYLRLSEEIGQAATNDMAKRLGVTSPLSTVYTTTLGVASVTPLDMASAYATLASGGVKRTPLVITKIEDKDGSVIYEAQDSSERVISEEVAGATTKSLRQVFEASDGTAQSAKLESGQPVAGKTGTSTDFADHWLVGNPAGSISSGEQLNCNTLWKDFMDQATSGRSIEQFPETKDPSYNNAFNETQKSKAWGRRGRCRSP